MKSHTDSNPSAGPNLGVLLHLQETLDLGQYTSESLYLGHWPKAGIYTSVSVLIPRERDHASLGAFENRSSVQKVEPRINSQMNNGNPVIELERTSLQLKMSSILKMY